MADIKEIENAIEVFEEKAEDLREYLAELTIQGNFCEKSSDLVKAIELVIPILQEKLDRENPQPLTLEELKEMEGEPVWVETMQQWRIVTINRENCLVCLLSECNRISAKHVFNNDGHIYRHKPKEASSNDDSNQS